MSIDSGDIWNVSCNMKRVVSDIFMNHDDIVFLGVNPDSVVELMFKVYKRIYPDASTGRNERCGDVHSIAES